MRVPLHDHLEVLLHSFEELKERAQHRVTVSSLPASSDEEEKFQSVASSLVHKLGICKSMRPGYNFLLNRHCTSGKI